ncbi:hypothetical protein [Xanthobacter sediminis]
MSRGEMPLYPAESDIARAVLGPGRASEWKAMAIVLERQGLPRIDPLMGARYWPAVRAWLDRHNGLATMPVPANSDGQETWQDERKSARRARA